MVETAPGKAEVMAIDANAEIIVERPREEVADYVTNPHTEWNRGGYL